MDCRGQLIVKFMCKYIVDYDFLKDFCVIFVLFNQLILKKIYEILMVKNFDLDFFFFLRFRILFVEVGFGYEGNFFCKLV